MRTLKRKKVNSFNSLLLFILSSVLVHGLLLFIFAQTRRSLPLTKQKKDQKPIDFVVIPPEEKVKEPPPETKKIAKNNSVAKGEVKPDLPVASNKVGGEAASIQATKPAPAIKQPAPQPQPETQKVSPPQPQAIKPPIQSELIKPEVKPQPQQKNEAIAKPEPIKPEPEIAKAPKKAAPLESNHPLLSKPQTKKPPVASAPPPAKQAPAPAIAKQPKLLPESKPPAPTQPDADSLAATSRNAQPPQTTPPPQPQSKPTAPDSGAASILGGNLSRSSTNDNGSTFFSEQVKASETVLNFSNSQNARRDPKLGPYFAKVHRRVKRNWRPSFTNDTKQTVLTFSIQRNGQISGLKVTRSSGSEKIDQESLAAVQNSAPFAALPADSKLSQLDIVFSFHHYIY